VETHGVVRRQGSHILSYLMYEFVAEYQLLDRLLHMNFVVQVSDRLLHGSAMNVNFQVVRRKSRNEGKCKFVPVLN
jgi:hypothetical protein